MKSYSGATFCFGIAALALLYGCSDIIDRANIFGSDEKVVVAEVGGRKIYLSDIDKEAQRYSPLFKLKEIKSPGQKAKLKESILHRVVDNIALEMEALRLKIPVTEEELDDEVHSLLGEYDDAKFQLTLAENKISFNEWKEALKKGIMIRKLVLSEIDSKIKVSEPEIKSYFKSNAEEFKWPERVRARQIMVDDETKAEQIRKRLLKKYDFAKMAKAESQSPDAADGGDLGFFGRGQMPPEFEAALFKLKVGEISEVIKSIYGFHLFVVTKKEKPRAMTYDEARERIRKILMTVKREKEFKNWLRKIKSELDVKTYPLALSAHR
ncbi:Peptidyl-prolyl cis-trans isomerase PpiD [hydrothermal vent metagenome]|uniref:Peptidyl-prolyl cis-trans isomerase PpiD n=1 Tax=hydrothermal vent metagenome TaxID=652676 RepID=A0A3B1BX31_9ZZZZ